MNLVSKKVIASAWIRVSLTLAMAYVSTLSPFGHNYHIHSDSLTGYEVSEYPNPVNEAHLADHHHHDEADPQQNDHQHTYDQHIDWHLFRSQTTQTQTFDKPYQISLEIFTLSNIEKSVIHEDVEADIVEEFLLTLSMFRAPPTIA